MRVRTLVCPLDLQVIFFPGRVRPVGVQADGPRPGQPVHVLLRLALRDDQIRLARDDAQHQLGQGNVVLEQATHEIIVDGPQPAQAFQVLLPLLFRSAQCFTSFP